MNNLLYLDKSRTQPFEASPLAGIFASVDANQEFVYILQPHGKSYRLMRARVENVMRIAEQVREVAADSAEAREALEVEQLIADTRMERARAMQPHSVQEAPGNQALTPLRAHFGNIAIDTASRVVERNGAPVRLAPLEFNLLVALYKKAGAAVSRAELMQEVWHGKAGVTHRTVDTHVFNLRRKLENNPAEPRHLLTVSKIGYRLSA